MQQLWLHKNGKPDCLLFLAGWGMDAAPFTDIPHEGLDILMVYDYRELKPVAMEQLKSYERVYLVAWSMGVWAAGRLLAPVKEHFAASIAVAGTLDPVHALNGIVPEQYVSMEKSLTLELMDDFYRSMFTDEDASQRFLKNKPVRQLKEMQAELHTFRTRYLNQDPAIDFFTHKVVTSRDRIFPPRNQLRAWGKENSQVIKLPHFPFYTYSGWKNFIEQTL